MSEPVPETVICRYRLKPGKEAEMERLLERHWPTLHAAGLTTDEPPRIYRSRPSSEPDAEDEAGTTYVEIFTWRSAEAPERAHHLPEVQAVWEPMGALCASMEFPHFDLLRG